MSIITTIFNHNELYEVKKVVKSLNMKFNFNELKKLNMVNNSYEISNNLIFFNPLNDGCPTKSFNFYKENDLNNKVIDMGIRKKANAGIEVYGVLDEVQNGLQLYSLPIEKDKQKVLK